ncbi:MAG: DDE-type integrase/transposase/recombinase, partial [Candidatus Omnitrophica bacterium]|nr:DDE-type integrase/transposase/recombinase [Candidatus Omnitrophota bacterium]
ITVNNDKFIAEITHGPSSEDIGDLGETSLKTDPSVKPKVLPARKIPLAMKDKVKAEIETLCQRGILVPVTEPTEWVSQMAVTEKSNGRYRICIDPQPLNEALQREHFKLPTLDDILPSLHSARVFSRLDVKEAYYHVRLDRPSSLLTTMATPWGRLRWTRLPFGLKVSSEIFQRRLAEQLEGLKGCHNVADDIIVTGCGDTDANAERDHDKKLSALIQRCQERHIKLNDAKAEMKKTETIFLGHLITKEGIKPDPAKVQAIVNMPAPTNIEGVRRVCGMVQYLARYIPNLSEDTEPLRELTRKNAQWKWTDIHQSAFQSIKSKISEATMLSYFDPNKPLILQADCSKDGVGVALLQDGKPIEYASKSLTDTQRRWAQIEKELFAVVYGLERFDQYTYARKVQVQNDHKPLEMILKKPLSQAPRRLQNLMMRLHRYDIEFQFIKGERLYIADTLSRAFIDSDQSSTTVPDDVNVNVLTGTEIPDSMIQKVREATKSDPEMQTLKTFIENGWPDDIKEVPCGLENFFKVRDTLSIDSEILMKGERLVIPKTLPKEVKQKLHAAHLGYDSMMRRARRCVYWPGINTEVQQMYDNCDQCQSLKPKNQKETLIAHDEGTYPWEKVGTDIFEIQNRSYMVTVDYFSNFIEVDYLPTTTTSTVIQKLKGHFARFGSPKVLISDSGPQYTSSQFSSFMNKWGITHKCSSPGHHQSNGKAESAVKIVKHMMKKSLQNGEDQYEALLELRNTPRQGLNISPSEQMFGRATRSLLPQLTYHDNERCRTPRAKQRENIAKHYNKTARNLPPLNAQQPVYYMNPGKPDWVKGKVTKKLNNRRYLIEGENGGKYIRNRVYLRPKSTPYRYQSEIDLDLDQFATPTAEPPDQGPPPLTRPQRQRKEPAWMQDFVTK